MFGVLFRMAGRMATVAQLWTAHSQAAFPGRLWGADVAGVEMVLLDADVAGCVSTWLHDRGILDGQQWDHLAICEQRLIRILPELEGFEAEYYQRLLDMTILLLESSIEPLSGGAASGI
jgi:hypothetical protein